MQMLHIQESKQRDYKVFYLKSMLCFERMNFIDDCPIVPFFGNTTPHNKKWVLRMRKPTSKRLKANHNKAFGFAKPLNSFTQFAR